VTLDGYSVRAVEKPKGRTKNFSHVLRPGEAIIVQALCGDGKWADGGTLQVAAVTNERFLIFESRLLRNSGRLHHEVGLDRIRYVQTTTTHPIALLGFPYYRTRVECVDGQVLELVSSGIGARKLRSLGRTLTQRIGIMPRHLGESSSGTVSQDP